MTTTVRLTPAQRAALALLATPGAVAYHGRDIRWRVVAHQDGMVLGTIHSVTLLALREAGYAEMFNGGEGPLDFRHRLTERGRLTAAQQSPAGAAGGSSVGREG